jgi:hypothetical protein
VPCRTTSSTTVSTAFIHYAMPNLAMAHICLPHPWCFLQADIHADEIIFKHLRSCPAVASASSEEQSDILPMAQQQQPGQGYSVSTTTKHHHCLGPARGAHTPGCATLELLVVVLDLCMFLHDANAVGFVVMVRAAWSSQTSCRWHSSSSSQDRAIW